MGLLIKQCYDQYKQFKHKTSIIVSIISESIKCQLTEPNMADNQMLITDVLNGLQNNVEDIITDEYLLLQYSKMKLHRVTK